ncbi:hypothetical protein CSW98_04695 [Vibrio sp. HA2012]|uniref:hypothetical protein n=1 Tax=Vibrio sp. HA2012 TaxID=1971595 RepID=UPI000C2C57B5|nr:hypothetical protein [Vibrio sp. HA2012]PJC87204.1 hypothetical protein CSW98_04695 [Vibrio sp. HA2012]
MKNLYIIRGPFGTGKTEFARIITDNVVSCWDYYARYGKNQWDKNLKPHSDEYCRTSVKDMMDKGTETIAVTNSFSKNEDLDYYYDLAEKHDYKVFCMVMNNRDTAEFKRNAPDEEVARQIALLKSNIMFKHGL